MRELTLEVNDHPVVTITQAPDWMLASILNHGRLDKCADLGVPDAPGILFAIISHILRERSS